MSNKRSVSRSIIMVILGYILVLICSYIFILFFGMIMAGIGNAGASSTQSSSDVNIWSIMLTIILSTLPFIIGILLLKYALEKKNKTNSNH